jgi:hypothetical protein
MAQMDFFRRPQLAGNNIPRLRAATVRGNIRRSDPDGISPNPYFPGASAGQTLNLEIDGAPVSVTLTGNALSTVLDDINTALGASGYAYPEDGVIAIQTNQIGANGSVEIVGGTAAAALGFDISLGQIRSTGGDIPSTPEGRVGNWFGVSFPNKNDNLTSESLNRPLARLAGNLDVLFSEHVREDALPRKVNFTASPDGRILTPNSADDVRVFTGLGLLSNASTKEELAPFFFLVDTVTKLPPASRVVGVVRGTPSGLPPYADATSWTGPGSTGNVLGVDLQKSSGTITSIKNGRVIHVAGANFVADKVRPGDYVKITGATNLTPWSNNGYRWVVEEVIDAQHIAVRPMSRSELAQVGTSSTEAQPIVELNMAKSGAEVYGSVEIWTGTYTNDVRIVVDPPIPSGATYELFLSSPGDLRSKRTYESQFKDVANREWASDLRPSPNVLLVSPTVASWNSSSVVLTGGYARFSDRVVSIPPKTFTAADFSTPGVNYVYWDKDTNEIKTTRSHVKVVNSDPTQPPGSGFSGDTQASQHIIAEVWKSGSNISSVLFEGRAVGEEAAHRVVTVGVGGQFSKLEDAVKFINRWAKGNNFRTSTYPQFEIVIVSDTTVDLSTITNNNNDYPATPSIFFDSSVKVRGASPNVKLVLKNYASGTPFDCGYSGSGIYQFEDLTITCDSSFSSVTLFFARSGSNVFFKNVRTLTDQGVGGFLDSVGLAAVIDSCVITGIRTSLITTSASSSSCDFEVFNSKVAMHSVVNSSPGIFYGTVAGDTFSAKRLIVRDCDFTQLRTDQGYAGRPLMGKFSSYTVFDGCTFSGVGLTPGQNSVLFKQVTGAGGLFISKCQTDLVLQATRCFIDSGSEEGRCYVDSCRIVLGPDDPSTPGIRAGSVTNCDIVGLTGTNQTLAAVSRRFAGNHVSGSAAIGVRNDLTYQTSSNFFADISYNRFELSGGTSILVTSNGQNNNGVTVHGNQILLQGANAVGIKTWEGANNLPHGEISGNIVRIRTGDGQNGKIGIYARGSCSLMGNQVFNAAGEATVTTGHIGIRLDTSTATRVVGNSVIFSAGSYTCMSVEGASHAALIHNNVFESTGKALVFSGGTSTNLVASYNRLVGTAAAVELLSADSFNGNYVVGSVTSPSPGQFRSIDGNIFSGTVTINGSASRRASVSNNSFNGTLNLEGLGVEYVEFFGNVVGGAFTTTDVIVNAHKNYFVGSATTVNFGNVVIEPHIIKDNVFSGSGQTIDIDASARVIGNSFLDNSQTLNFGDSGHNGNGYYQEFKDNYCICTTNIYSDDTTNLVVEGNHLAGATSIQEVDRFNNNFLNTSNGGQVTGRRSLVGGGRAPASGNVLTSSGNWTFNNLDFGSSDFKSSSGTVTFNNCSISGCSLDLSAASLFDCEVGSSKLAGTGSFSLHNTSVTGSDITNSSFTTTGGAVGGCRIIGCKAYSGLFITVNAADTEVLVADTKVSGALTISKTNNNQRAVVKDCVVSGNLTISGGSSADVIDVSGCFVSGYLSAQAGGNDGRCTVSNSTLQSLSQHYVGAWYETHVKGCQFGGKLNVSGTAKIVTISSNFIGNGLEFVSDASGGTGLRYTIDGNTINSDRVTHGIAFPDVNSGVDGYQHIVISSNNINVAEGTGSGALAVMASGIYFSDGVSNVTIVGNSISLGNGAADPTLVNGSFTYAAIQTGPTDNGAGGGNSACKNWVISGNRISIGVGLTGHSFRSGALTISYKYIRLKGDSQGTSVSGNIMTESYGVPSNTAPQNGAHYFRDITNAPYTVP